MKDAPATDKTLEEIDFARSTHIPASHIHALAGGGDLGRIELSCWFDKPGTSQSHLPSGVVITACRQAAQKARWAKAKKAKQLKAASADSLLPQCFERRVPLTVGRVEPQAEDGVTTPNVKNRGLHFFADDLPRKTADSLNSTFGCSRQLTAHILRATPFTHFAKGAIDHSQPER
jgi:hypothetical protein